MKQADSAQEAIALTIRRHVAARTGGLEVVAKALDLSASVVKSLASGKMKLPYGKVALLARVLRAEPADLMWRVIREYDPDLFIAMEQAWPKIGLTKNQQRLLKLYERVAKGNDAYPVLVTGVTLVIAKDSAMSDSEL
jgi:hypothetical protein